MAPQKIKDPILFNFHYTPLALQLPNFIPMTYATVIKEVSIDTPSIFYLFP
ncbi:hypothetical protein BAZMOX_25285_0 [methanotrophic endosymbiont of Bathymodiolus azoricus (Menez Gwen)]|nr:hypothetical protein BAZMOX_25285_0 [methanotrophic endosymbiont of Bathymodiolus azoricus (Menez Gwen)]